MPQEWRVVGDMQVVDCRMLRGCLHTHCRELRHPYTAAIFGAVAGYVLGCSTAYVDNGPVAYPCAAVLGCVALVDAGYYSEDNIKELYSKDIAFLTRLPAGRKLYKSLIQEHRDVENAENIVLYGKRALYVKCVQVDLFGHEGFAYVVCDIKRKGNEINSFLISAKEYKLSDDEINEALVSKGKFIIISSEKIPTNEVIPLYYTRQSAENLFGVSKSFLDFLPLRTHNIDTLRGYLLLTFISLLVYIAMKKMLKNEFTVEGALIEMGNLMCKSFGKDIIVSEPTKKMKAVASLLGHMVSMRLGV